MAVSPRSTGARAQNNPDLNQVNTIIALARAAGKCPPALEGTWRAIGQKDISALEALNANTPVNPSIGHLSKEYANRLRGHANNVGHELSVLQTMMFAYKAAADAETMGPDRVCGLYWPHLMETLLEKIQKIDPVESEMNAIASKMELLGGDGL